MNPYTSAFKNTLYFSLFLLAGGLDHGGQVRFCLADLLRYREQDAALVLAVMLLRVGSVAVARIIGAFALAVFAVVTLIAGISSAVIPGSITYTKQKHLAVFHKLIIYEIPPVLYLFKRNPYTPIL